jgi:hypothetical protein
MDSTLGVTGYTIGNFETLPLIPGVTIVLSGGGVPLTTFTSLPNLFDQAVCGSLSDNSAWDGTHAVINSTTNTISNCNTPANISNTIVVNYGPGASSLGLGFGNFQSLSGPIPITNHELFVNGVDMGVIETLAGANWTPGLARNAYLRIDTTGGTSITSVAIQNLTALDVLVLDHLAIRPATTPVPEPSFCVPVLVGVLLAGKRLRKRIHA